MKILNWNCNGAFRNKYHLLSAYNADLLIIQECENPEYSISKTYKEWAANYLWIGDSKNKGIGVFAKPEIRLARLDWSNLYNNHPVKHFLPCTVNETITLLAVWTHKNNSPNFGYIGQFWKYLQLHKEKLNNAIITGDFNSNKIWDEWDRWWNHTDVVRELDEIGLKSLYHTFYKEEEGKESRPTFYLHKNLHKPYHIDYCFASSFQRKAFKKISIEPFENWKKYSDHTPIFIRFNKLL
jgi:exonuclease III